MIRSIGYAALAVVAFAINAPVDAQESISIPLQGSLPVRCSAQAAGITIDDTQSAPAVSVTVEHACNARNNLVVSFSQIADPVDFQIDATYGGQTPSAISARQISFFSSGPISGSRQLRLALPGGSRDDAERLAQALQISVEAL